MRLTRLACLLLALPFLAYGCKDKPKPPQQRLDTAAFVGDLERCRMLIAEGADVNARNGRGQTPLHCAAERGHEGVVEFLIASGADVNAEDESGWTPIYEIYDVYPFSNELSPESKEVVELLLARGAEILEGDTRDNRRLLMFAVQNGCSVLAKEVLTQGTDPRIRDFDGDTALRIAAEHGDVETAKLLIAHGADVDAGHSWRYPRTGPIFAAVSSVDPNMVQLLIAGGAKLNVVDNEGETPLHIAARAGNSQVAELLLTGGANVAALNRTWDTPLHRAARKGHRDAAALLLAHGAEVNARAMRKATPLHRAAYGGHREAAALLLSAGADVNARDDDGDTPLHSAALRGYKEVVELLLAHGSDANAEDDRGLTPRDDALWRRHPDIAELLLKHGARDR